MVLFMPQVVPTISVVDDDISVRESLEALIRHEGWQPQLFESASAFLSSPQTPGPGCLILDVNLPDLNGLDIQERVAADRASVPIIFLTGYGDVPMTVRAMKAGAVEFLTKPFSDEVLLEAIRNAIARSIERLEHSARKRMLQERLYTLSSREREVLELVVKGLLNKQVGAELGISEITVKTHRGKAMQKMRARSLADLVGIAAELGIATGPNG
jgi:RNA polymerase sigma factor (sigma-70 family)